MFDDPKSLEAILTGSIGAIGVAMFFIRSLIADKKELREDKIKLEQLNETMRQEGQELLREAIGSITQVFDAMKNDKEWREGVKVQLDSLNEKAANFACRATLSE